MVIVASGYPSQPWVSFSKSGCGLSHSWRILAGLPGITALFWPISQEGDDVRCL